MSQDVYYGLVSVTMASWGNDMSVKWKPESWKMTILQPKAKERRNDSTDHPTPFLQLFGGYCIYGACKYYTSFMES